MQQSYQKYVAYHQPKRKYAQSSVIEHVIGLIGQESDKLRVLASVLPYALQISQADTGALLVIDSDEKNMAVVSRHNMPDEIIEQLTKGDLGHLLVKGQWLRVEPKSSDSSDKQNTILGQHKLRILLGVPLQSGKRVLGAIVVGAHSASRTLLEQDRQEHLAALAQLMGLYLDNVRLRTTSFRTKQQVDTPVQQPEVTAENPVQLEPSDQVVNDLEELLEAVMSAEEEVVNQNHDLGLLNALSSQVGKTLQLSDVINTAIEQSLFAMNVEFGWCYLFEDGVLTLRGHQGLSEKYIDGMAQLKPGNGAEGMAFSRNEVILKDSLLFHSGRARRLVKEEGICTVAAVPLLQDNEPFGVLAVGSKTERAWSPRDERMFISIGRQVAQAIANSQMFSKSQQQANNLEANFTSLQMANRQLAERATELERQVQALRQAKEQIWLALAASSKSRYRPDSTETDTDEQLTNTIKRVLGKLGDEGNISLTQMVEN